MCLWCRTRKFKRHTACFVGTDAVAWMMSHHVVPNVEQAEKLGNDLMHLGLIFEVAYKHNFRNKNYLYR